jgi:hypothetical protein
MTTTRIGILIFAAAALLPSCATRSNVATQSAPPVTLPPESFFQGFAPRDREAARQFYKKQ